jgi:uncharacterized protein (TIGR02145 family)
MKTKFYLLIIWGLYLTLNLPAQNKDLILTFTAENNGEYLVLDSVLIRNLTQGEDIMLYDTSYIVNNDQLAFNSKSDIVFISDNYPNPFTSETHFDVYLPSKSFLNISVNNLIGQTVARYSNQFERGNHVFRFSPGNEICYFLTVSGESFSKTLKLINNNNNPGNCSISYTSSTKSQTLFKNDIITSGFLFDAGDELLMVGYAGSEESGFSDAPETSMDYVFQFATNIPCPGYEIVEFEGQEYNTIQVKGQCWMKENLNVGDMISANNNQSNNNTIEKYCMLNDENWCDQLGGLYQWNEAMQYANETGGQGICPDGWHIPSDQDWRVLEGVADSEYAICATQWGGSGWRGTDAGGNLKTTGTEWWQYPNTGATDAFGFSVLPAGYIVQNGFWGVEYKAYFWSSEYPEMYYRDLDWDQAKIKRDDGDGLAAFSIRCIKNP